MFFKNLYNKLSHILLSVFILNLITWNLLLVPAQTQAATTRFSCDPETGECFPDDNGSYTCPTACANACSISEDSITSSSKCGSAPITDTINVYIVGSSEQSAAETAAQEGINTLEDLANVTGLIDEAKQSLIDLINGDKPIPEDLKEFIISAIKNDTNIPNATKNTLIDLINKNKAIPEELKGIMTTMIENLKDTTSLIKNKFLDLILSGLNIDWICQQLANAVTGLPWGIGAPISAAIAMSCPILLDALLTELGFYKLKSAPGEMTQTIPVPTFKYYQWEVGLPGFIKPGQIIEFK